MSSISNAYQRLAPQRFPLPSEPQVAALEERIGVHLPIDYRQFLLDFNGGKFDDEPEIAVEEDEARGDGLVCLHGINSGYWRSELADPRHMTVFFESDENPAFLPIGHTSLGGYIVLFLEPDNFGAIYFKKAFGDYYYLADGIAEFFDCLGVSS